MTTNRLRSLVVAIAALATLLGVVLTPAAAAVQSGDPTLTIDSHDLSDETSFVAIVSLDVTNLDIAAISAVVDWDADVLRFLGCVADESGVCNEVDGRVHFAGFAVDGFVSTERFIEVEFAVLDRTAPTELTVSVDTAAGVTGEETAPLSGSSAFVTFNTGDLQADEPLQDEAVDGPLPTGGVNGEVLDGAGVGVFGAQVCMVSATSEPRCAATSGLGAFLIEGVADGAHTIVASDPNAVLPTVSGVVEVASGQVTTGVSLTMVPQAEVVAGPEEFRTTELDGPAPLPVEVPEAGPGEIVAQVTAQDGGHVVFGAEACATMPVIGTQACGFTDADGLVVLTDLAVGNYELTVTDPAGRFDPASPEFVGVNPDAGANVDLSLPGLGMGERPDVLAFVDAPERSRATGIALAAAGLGLMIAAGVVLGRRD